MKNALSINCLFIHNDSLVQNIKLKFYPYSPLIDPCYSKWAKKPIFLSKILSPFFLGNVPNVQHFFGEFRCCTLGASSVTYIKGPTRFRYENFCCWSSTGLNSWSIHNSKCLKIYVRRRKWNQVKSRVISSRIFCLFLISKAKLP